MGAGISLRVEAPKLAPSRRSDQLILAKLRAGYSGCIPAAFTSSPRTCNAPFTTSESSSGLPAITTRPRFASFPFTASAVSTLATPALSFAITSAGVPAGANRPIHDDISNPGTVSPIAGTSGIAA